MTLLDFRKLQQRLLTNWKSIPIEVAPIAAHRVQHRLRELGSSDPHIREGPVSKAGPLKTDQDFFIIDAKFPQLLTASDVAAGKDGSGKDGVWEVEALAKEIKEIQGVLEVGLFVGKNGPDAAAAGVEGGMKPIAAYFGMEDGSVELRTAKN
jgi:ribose 5-phosphate isomerase A